MVGLILKGAGHRQGAAASAGLHEHPVPRRVTLGEKSCG